MFALMIVAHYGDGARRRGIRHRYRCPECKRYGQIRVLIVDGQRHGGKWRANEIQRTIVTGHAKTIIYNNRKMSPFMDTLIFVRLRWGIVYLIVFNADRSNFQRTTIIETVKNCVS